MKTYLECIPCFFRQAQEAAELAGASVKTQKKIADKLARKLPSFPLTATPPEMGRIIHQIVRTATKKKDPYLAVKNKSNQMALAQYPLLKKKVRKAKDKLLVAVELSIAGNIIDYGVKNSLAVDKELARIMRFKEASIQKRSRVKFQYCQFKRDLRKAKKILYIADNAGETVFDRILIEEIKRNDKTKRVYYAVKGSPIINDALKKDAVVCGLDQIAEIISSGVDAPGTIFSLCKRDFLSIYNKADLVICKGQGNFESLSARKLYPSVRNMNVKMYFLFMAKCPVVAKHLKCQLRDNILISK